jgi:hypothetical protein
MEGSQAASSELLPGRRVRARVTAHRPWGVFTCIIGHEDVGSSVDMIQQFGAERSGSELHSMFPPIGAEIDAVIERVRNWNPPMWVYLSIRPRDLESFSWPCDFCLQPAVLSPGGDGLILEARTNDGPGSYLVITHRSCLADRLHPDLVGVRARTLNIGRQPPGGLSS